MFSEPKPEEVGGLPARQSNQGELAPMSPQEQAIQQVFGVLGGRSLSNFKGDEREQWRFRANATGPNCKPVTEIPAEGIDVTYFYAHGVQLDGPTPGEVVDAVRCVLITKDGQCYQAVSNYLARDLADMIRVFGLQPWEPPVKIRVQVNKGKAGHTFYTIVPV